MTLKRSDFQTEEHDGEFAVVAQGHVFITGTMEFCFEEEENQWEQYVEGMNEVYAFN